MLMTTPLDQPRAQHADSEGEEMKRRITAALMPNLLPILEENDRDEVVAMVCGTVRGSPAEGYHLLVSINEERQDAAERAKQLLPEVFRLDLGEGWTIVLPMKFDEGSIAVGQKDVA